MLTTKNFETRANALFESCRDRWRKKLNKGLPKSVQINIAPEDVLPFSRREFQAWLWKAVGLQAVSCCYCRAPIDIMNLSLDHKTPLRRGGGPELENLQPICKGCNGTKGEFTHEEYSLIVLFMEGPGASFRQRLEGIMRNGGMAIMMRFFPGRDKAKKKRPSKVQDSLEFTDLPDF
jgi:5-methylcytosine-specific restriction endonuclease McrA